MARLIDAMRIDFDEVDITECTDVDDIIWVVEKLIDAQPIVDAVPVVHGRWIIHSSGKGDYANNWAECSNCRVSGSPQWKRCPVCEAKMEVEHGE